MEKIIEKPLEVDIHVHTVVSGHAFSTLWEFRSQAIQKGIKLIGIADHGPSMIGAPHEEYFSMGQDVNCASKGCVLLFGCEANILSENGMIDITSLTVSMLDFLLAGLHSKTPYCDRETTRLQNTKALVNCIEMVSPTAISHPIYPSFPIEINPVVRAAAHKGVALEINARTIRNASDQQIITSYHKLIQVAGMYGADLLLSSDSHFVDDLGNVSYLHSLKQPLIECQNLIVNRDLETFKEWWNSKEKNKLTL